MFCLDSLESLNFAKQH